MTDYAGSDLNRIIRLEEAVQNAYGVWVTHATWGAVGDGTTDDTNALNDCLAYCIETGQEMYLPPFAFKFTQILVETSGSALGPIRIKGGGARDPRYTQNGSRLIQDDAYAGAAIKLVGDWSTNDSLLGLNFRGFALQTGAANDEAAIDLFNVSGYPSFIQDLTVIVGNAACDGIKAASCWCMTIIGCRISGGATGDGTWTGVGLRIYGEQGAGTTNQITVIGCNVTNMGHGYQVGKWQETGGGTTQGITIIGGQAGHCDGYGFIQGWAKDVVWQTNHSEVNGKSGFVTLAAANGSIPSNITFIRNDSYGEGEGGDTTGDDRYAFNMQRGMNIRVLGHRFQECQYGIHQESNDNLSQVLVEDVDLAAPTGGGQVAWDVEGTTSFATDKRQLYKGLSRITGTWATVYTRPNLLGRVRLDTMKVYLSSDNPTPPASERTSQIRFNYTTPVNVTDIVEDTNESFYEGQTIDLFFDDNNVTLKDVTAGGNFRLPGATDFATTNRDVVTIIRVGSEWWCKSSSVN